MIDLNYCFIKNIQILSKQLDNELVLIDPYRQTVIKLNATALEIWRLLDGKHSVSQIIDFLQEEFEIEKKIVQKDVLYFIKELIRREIVK